MTPKARDRFDVLEDEFWEKWWRRHPYGATSINREAPDVRIADLLRTVARDARSAALEEAAKVCDGQTALGDPSYQIAAWNCAVLVRALGGTGEESDG